PFRKRLVGWQTEHLEDALGARERALNRLPLVAERRDRLEELLKEQDERRQRPDRDSPRREQVTRTSPQQDRRCTGGEGCHDREVPRGIDRRTVEGQERLAEGGAEPGHELGLGGEGADHFHAAETFLEMRV